MSGIIFRTRNLYRVAYWPLHSHESLSRDWELRHRAPGHGHIGFPTGSMQND